MLSMERYVLEEGYLKYSLKPQASFCAIVSSRISRTVRGTMIRCSRLKKESTSRKASDEYSNETKKPLVRSSRIIAASNISISGLPALFFCFT